MFWCFNCCWGRTRISPSSGGRSRAAITSPPLANIVPIKDTITTSEAKRQGSVTSSEWTFYEACTDSTRLSLSELRDLEFPEEMVSPTASEMGNGCNGLIQIGGMTLGGLQDFEDACDELKCQSMTPSELRDLEDTRDLTELSDLDGTDESHHLGSMTAMCDVNELEASSEADNLGSTTTGDSMYCEGSLHVRKLGESSEFSEDGLVEYLSDEIPSDGISWTPHPPSPESTRSYLSPGIPKAANCVPYAGLANVSAPPSVGQLASDKKDTELPPLPKVNTATLSVHQGAGIGVSSLSLGGTECSTSWVAQDVSISQLAPAERTWSVEALQTGPFSIDPRRVCRYWSSGTSDFDLTEEEVMEECRSFLLKSPHDREALEKVLANARDSQSSSESFHFEPALFVPSGKGGACASGGVAFSLGEENEVDMKELY